MKWVWRILLVLLIIGLTAAAVIYLIDRHIWSVTSAKLQTSMTEIPADEPKRVAIVFGARVWDDGSPSNTLYDRVMTGVELYRAGRVKTLLMSGDRSGDNYDEPSAMKKLAVQLGIPESDIVLDNDGKKTYDTCYRAKEIFDVQKAMRWQWSNDNGIPNEV